ncbi:MAG: aldolase [Alphaproteobacteria bacterium]|nr:aldolase [Alphaproteobacteria bacterium]
MTGPPVPTVHATAVALRGRGPASWRAILLRGPSGAGKSDLALRMIEAGGRLVADDRVHLARQGRALVASAPRELLGLLEVRGLGIVRLLPSQLLALAPVVLLVDLVTRARVPRLPERASETVAGVSLPRLRLHAFDASTPVKLRLALADQVAA